MDPHNGKEEKSLKSEGEKFHFSFCDEKKNVKTLNVKLRNGSALFIPRFFGGYFYQNFVLAYKSDRKGVHVSS